MKYEANPVSVDASRIMIVLDALPSGHVGLCLEEGFHLATPEQLARIKPAVGDYVVTQEDGYVYLNPKDVFERKYSPVTVEPIQADDIEIMSDGRIIGRMERVEEFREFCKMRGKLLAPNS